MVEVNIRIKNVEYNLNLNRRVTIIQGDSGSGKTSLYNLVEELPINNNITISSKMRVEVLPLNILNKNVANEYLTDNLGNIVIIDERSRFTRANKILLSDQQFIQTILKYNIWYIILARDLEIIKGLDYSPKEIYEICELQESITNNKIIRKLKSKYDFTKINSKTYKSVKTEDSGGGLEFFKGLGVDIQPITNGSTKVIEEFNLGKLYCKAVMIDLANFRYNFEILYNEALLKSLDIINRESFEEQLLKSSLFTRNKILSKELNTLFSELNNPNFISWEKAYTDILDKMIKYIKGRKYSYCKSSNKLPSCLQIPCSECQDRENCDYANFNIKDKGLDILKQNDLDYLLEKGNNENIKSVSF